MNRVFIFEKLIRDHLVGVMRQKGISVFTRTLEQGEVTLKFKQEFQEVCSAHTKKETALELADGIEGVQAMASYHGLSFEEIRHCSG